ncbi:22920_t:CDS:2 [Gigaspora margarita]|uniref:22920_t:CDS:1 n=1 Tax=Gigaspora margarita TaxID=4874 RepID=A0ABN7U895_GIGMA|nr:22920_t:CDS:2 [Gigaspora margarita]
MFTANESNELANIVKDLQLQFVNLKLSDQSLITEISFTGLSEKKKLELDNFNINVLYQDKFIGGATIKNFILESNDQKLIIRCDLNHTTVDKSVIGDLLSQIASQEEVTLKAEIQQVQSALNKIDYSVIDDRLLQVGSQKAVISKMKTYDQQAVQLLNKIDLSVTLHRQKSIIKNVTLNDLELEYENNCWYLSTSNLKIDITIPFGFPLNIKKISLDNVKILDEADKLVATFSDKFVKTFNDKESEEIKRTDEIQLSIEKVCLDIGPNRTGFEEFAKKLINDKYVTFKIVCEASSTVFIPLKEIEDIKIEKMKISNNNRLDGLEISKNKPIIKSIRVIGGTENRMEISLDVTFKNSSGVVKITIPNIKLDLVFNKVKIGEVIIPETNTKNFTLKYENSYNNVKAYLCPVSGEEKEFKKFINNYLNGCNSEVILCGHKDSTNIKSLKKIMETIRLNAEVPGMDRKKHNIVTDVKLIKSSIISNFGSTIINLIKLSGKISVDVEIQFENPFETELTILSIYGTVYNKHKETIGSLDQKVNITIHKLKDRSEKLSIDVELGSAVNGIDILNLKHLKARLAFDKITVRVDKYRAEVKYGKELLTFLPEEYLPVLKFGLLLTLKLARLLYGEVSAE